MGQDYFPIARAGLEMDIRAPGAPYIVKTPFLCDWLDQALTLAIVIEHAIVPVRPFEAAAASRAFVQQQATGSADGAAKAAGGLWDANSAAEQADVLRRKFAALVEALVRHDIATTFLSHPRLARDPDYLYGKMRFLLDGVDAPAFKAAFSQTVRPDLIHQFTEADR